VDNIKALPDWLERLFNEFYKNYYELLVLGNTKAGKSTFINNLIGM
jgi:ribosome biogenesis GTPase A